MSSEQDWTNTAPAAHKVLMPTGGIEHGSDEIDGALIEINTVHHHVHEGEAFISWTNFENVADSGVVDMLLVTGTLEVHLRLIDLWVNNARATYDMYENAQGTGTTRLAARNRSRRQAEGDMQATMAVYSGITNPNIGSDIVDHGVAGGGGANTASRTGGRRNINFEMVLRSDTTYAIRFQNLSGATADMEVALMWYEEETPA